MFGSLRLEKQRADAAEQALYRAHFCAGCHALHGIAGRLSSLTTNYDQTILALVLGGLEPTRELSARACTALPWRTIEVRPLSAPSQALLASANLALVRAKLRDDVDDERRLRSRLGLRLVAGPVRRAEERLRALGFPCTLLGELPQRQREAEAAAEPTLESLAAPTAEVLGQVFAHAARIADRVEHAPALRGFGAGLGGAIYVWDAVSDRRRDRERGVFNAAEATAGRDDAFAFLYRQLGAAERALSAVPLGRNGVLIQAVLASLRARVETAEARASRFARRCERSREAGDCDCGACDCCTVDCCAGADGASGCCDLCCCFGGDDRACWSRKSERKRGSAEALGDPTTAVRDLSALIGVVGTTRTDLAPDGRVRVGALDYDARTLAGALPRGVEVIVRSVSGGVLVVEPAAPSSS